MEHTALLRAAQAVAPRSLDELRPRRSGGLVVLRCTVPGCAACADFESRRGAFERTLGATAPVVPWDCSRPAHRRLAVAAGVDDLPAYVLLPPGREPLRVRRPPSR